MLSGISGQWYPSSSSEVLKKTLHEQGIPFTVAPYSALAQVCIDSLHHSLFTQAMLMMCSSYTMRSTRIHSSTPYTAHQSSSASALTSSSLNSRSQIAAKIWVRSITRTLLSRSFLNSNGSIDETALQPSAIFLRISLLMLLCWLALTFSPASRHSRTKMSTANRSPCSTLSR